MRIGNFPLNSYSPQTINKPAATDNTPTAVNEQQSAGFGDQVTQAIDNVDALQKNASSMATKVAAGNTDDTHKAIIAMEHSLMALDFTIQVRNKTLEAYQEIMKTQM
ncbi:MAG: flagellar hook-basal body complex protein FliE [bacterium]